MRVILGFVVGVLVGAGGLFAWLHQMPQTQPQTQAADTRTGSLPAPAPGPTLDGQLPPAPHVMPDLTELDLPLRPAIGDAAADASPNNVAASALPDGKLAMPVEGVDIAQVSDTYDQSRGNARNGERRHEALDIMAPRGAKVFAVAASWSSCSPASRAA
jgi:hypothetical protein